MVGSEGRPAEHLWLPTAAGRFTSAFPDLSDRSVVKGARAFRVPFTSHMPALPLRHMSSNEGPGPAVRQVNAMTLWATVALLVAVIASGAAMAVSGMETTAIIGFLTEISIIGGGVVAILDRVTTVHRVNVEQDQKLETVVHQTNGALSSTVETIVNNALDKRFGPPKEGGPAHGTEVQGDRSH